MLRYLGRLALLGDGVTALACAGGDADTNGESVACELPYRGQRYDEVGDCLEPLREFSCVPEQQSCEPTPTAARSDRGECWLLEGNCLPPEWSELGSGAEEPSCPDFSSLAPCGEGGAPADAGEEPRSN